MEFHCILILSFLIINIHARTATALANLPPKVTVPALLTYGDSLVDTGNNNFITTAIKSNYKPYGIDFKGLPPSGRFSNGKVLADIISEELGLKDALPPYLDPAVKDGDLVQGGVSFASGGAGYDPLTSTLQRARSLDDQLKSLREFKDRIARLITLPRANTFLQQTVHIVAAGSDDLANNYFPLTERKAQYNINAYTDFLVDNAVNFVRALYDTGMRRIGVLGIPAIGCAPSLRTPRGCAQDINQAATMFNSKLSRRLSALRGQLRGSRIVYMDIYNVYLNLAEKPSETGGFTVGDRACCATGHPGAPYLCKAAPTACPDTYLNVFWDGYHLTHDANRVLYMLFFNDYVKQLF